MGGIIVLFQLKKIDVIHISSRKHEVKQVRNTIQCLNINHFDYYLKQTFKIVFIGLTASYRHFCCGLNHFFLD